MRWFAFLFSTRFWIAVWILVLFVGLLPLPPAADLVILVGFLSHTVWFVFDSEKLYLLPVRGSDTQWYRNVLKNPLVRIDARGAEGKFRALAIRHARSVRSVIEKFREKYDARDVKKYYSKFDVAIVAEPV